MAANAGVPGPYRMPGPPDKSIVSVHDVVKILVENATLLGNWKRFYASLLPSSQNSLQLETSLNHNRMTMYDIFIEILSQCVMVYGKEAKVMRLYRALMKDRFIEIAEELSDRYGLSCTIVQMTAEYSKMATNAGVPGPSRTASLSDESIVSVHDVVKILVKNATLLGNWKRFYNSLQIPSPNLLQWETSLIHNTITMYDIFIEILSQWVMVYGKEAKVRRLYEALMEESFIQIAEELNHRYDLSCTIVQMPAEYSKIAANAGVPGPSRTASLSDESIVYVQDVVNILIEDAGLVRNWKRFFHSLQIPSPNFFQWETLFSNNKMTIYDIFIEMVSHWVKPFGKEAKVRRLYQALIEEKFIAIAEGLSDHYDLSCTIVQMPGRQSSVSQGVGGDIHTTRLGDSGIFYDHTDIIGNGATAIVYRGYFDIPGKPAAVKCVFNKDYEIFKNELEIWHTADDGIHIVRCFKYLEWDTNSDPKYYFAMELATMSLEKYVVLNDANYGKISKYLSDACKGLLWLHQKKIIHRDVKPANILVFANGIGKLGDFGISRKITSSTEGTNSMGKGTFDYLSPEAMQSIDRRQRFINTIKIDIFSMGVTIHNCLAKGNHLFGSQIQRYQNVINGNYDWSNLVEGDIGIRVKSLVSSMTKYNDNERPNVDTALEHPFFWNGKHDLEFIKSVSEYLSDMKNDSTVVAVKGINAAYRAKKGGIVDWLQSVDPETYRLLTGKHKRNYNTAHLTELVNLIRDKSAHSVELDKLLLSEEHFGRNGVYCEEKYVSFFTRSIPELVTFLYCELQAADSTIISDIRSRFYSKNSGHFICA